MDAHYFQLLYDYAWWARDRLLKAADGMTEEEFSKPNGFNYPSLRNVLTHALAAEAGYSARWRGDSDFVRPTEADVATVEAMRQRWQEEQAKTYAFLAGLSDDDLRREIVTTNRAGVEFHRSLALDLTQIANHGTQHRSEAAEALTMVGRSPGDMDFSAFLQETGKR